MSDTTVPYSSGLRPPSNVSFPTAITKTDSFAAAQTALGKGGFYGKKHGDRQQFRPWVSAFTAPYSQVSKDQFNIRNSFSARESALRSLAIQRVPVSSKLGGVTSTSWVGRPQYREALLIEATSTLTFAPKCQSCEDSKGPFQECVVDISSQSHKCGNCTWTGSACNRTFQRRSPSSDSVQSVYSPAALVTLQKATRSRPGSAAKSTFAAPRNEAELKASIASIVNVQHILTYGIRTQGVPLAGMMSAINQLGVAVDHLCAELEYASFLKNPLRDAPFLPDPTMQLVPFVQGQDGIDITGICRYTKFMPDVFKAYTDSPFSSGMWPTGRSHFIKVGGTTDFAYNAPKDCDSNIKSLTSFPYVIRSPTASPPASGIIQPRNLSGGSYMSISSDDEPLISRKGLPRSGSLSDQGSEALTGAAVPSAVNRRNASVSSVSGPGFGVTTALPHHSSPAVVRSVPARPAGLGPQAHWNHFRQNWVMRDSFGLEYGYQDGSWVPVQFAGPYVARAPSSRHSSQG